MIGLVLIAALAAADVEQEAPEVGVLGGLGVATALSPGAHVSFMLGARFRVRHFSVGVEGAFYLPGGDEVVTYNKFWGYEVGTVSSVAIVGSLPVCFHSGVLSVCGVGVAGAAASRSDFWAPLLQGGVRLAFDPHLSDTFSAYLALQALSGAIHQPDGWLAVPLQVGVMLAVLHASS